MKTISANKTIREAVEQVRNTSFQEKKNIVTEERINSFLDTILDLKMDLEKRTEILANINSSFEKITWFTDINSSDLMLVNDLISSAKDLYTTLLRQYVRYSSLRSKGIAKAEIKNYKSAIDHLKESYSDLESVFFFLPEMPSFKETTKELSLL